ncbi:SPOR domain-containing protein [Fodinibius salsisoli]|uniref:SPOR domain-containing protein n=1 Tax=Fodinibius salsisoli TaxID=2820877 RepID=A0ABT3PQL8_9BACT|nr:SPOR domain-containing protein [Fodinibius salsisoli]MCW9708148.1 SPOR domain-containing protein [Fodinibius salsisoli]
MKNISLLILCLTTLLLSSCGTVQKSSSSGPSGGDSPDSGTLTEEEAMALEQLLDQNRNHLADLQRSEQLEIPRAFLKEDTTSSTTDNNPYRGYRIQLISTRDIQRADTTAEGFNQWITEEMPNYRAKSYISFKQPYYKVHVGDFQSRTRAIQFTQAVKKRYPDAWIVPDEINPGSVPADTVSFEMKEDKEVSL